MIRNKEEISDSVFHERYIQFFKADERERFHKLLGRTINNETFSVEIHKHSESYISFILISSYNPVLFAAYCAVLSMQDFEVTAVDLFTGITGLRKKISLDATGRLPLSVSVPVMVCEYRIKGDKAFLTDSGITKIIKQLRQAEEAIIKCSSEEQQIFIDKLTRQIVSHAASISNDLMENSVIFKHFNYEGLKLYIEKDFSLGYLFIFSLLIKCSNINPHSLMYRRRDSIEMFELEVEKEVNRFFTATSNTDSLPRLLRILNICTDVIEPLAYAADPIKALERLCHLSDSLSEEMFERFFGGMKNEFIRDSIYRVIGSSDFLWEEFIRSNYVSFLDLITDASKRHYLVPSKKDIEIQVDDICNRPAPFEKKYQLLNQYKDHVLFSIRINYLMGTRPDVGTLANQLIDLANIIIKAFVKQVSLELDDQYGLPVDVNGKEITYCVYGLGKLGGAALGFASDLELLFIYEGQGKTTGPKIIEAYEYFDRLVKRFLAVFKIKRNGIFEPDMRLRPYGKKGNLATTINDFIKYYSPVGASHALERIALFRMNPIYGSSKLHYNVQELLINFFNHPGYIKLKQLNDARSLNLRKTNLKSFNMKHSSGALVDLETTVQLLQIHNIQSFPFFWTPRIYRAIPILYKNGVLTKRQRKSIYEAYYFFRRTINGLRILRGVADNISLDYDLNPDLAPLARRAGYKMIGSLDESEQMLMHIRWHSSSVRSLAIRFFNSDLISDHEISGIEDLFHRRQIPFRYIKKFFNQKGAKVSPQIMAVFLELFDIASKSKYPEYLITIAGDIIFDIREPEVACTRLVIILKEILKRKMEIDNWIGYPGRLRLMIKMISNGRTYFYILKTHPELLDLFFLASHEARLWYRQYLLEQLDRLFSGSPEREELLNDLRILKQKLDFFIAVFTLDRVIGFDESVSLLHAFVTKLLKYYSDFLIMRAIDISNQNHIKYNPEMPQHAICVSYPRCINVRVFSAMPVFIIYEDWYIKEFDERSNQRTREYYADIIRDLCDDLSSVTSDSLIVNLDLFGTVYNIDSVFAVSDKISDKELTKSIMVSSTVAGDQSLLPRLKSGLKSVGISRVPVENKAGTAVDIISEKVLNICPSCACEKQGADMKTTCKPVNLYQELYRVEIITGEDGGQISVELFNKMSEKINRGFY